VKKKVKEFKQFFFQNKDMNFLKSINNKNESYALIKGVPIRISKILRISLLMNMINFAIFEIASKME